MGQVNELIRQLQAGETLRVRPEGHSMSGRVESGQLCTIEPVTDPSTLAVGDIVLCRVGQKDLLHLIKAVDGDLYQIANNHGRVNGWTSAENIFGKCVKVEP